MYTNSNHPSKMINFLKYQKLYLQYKSLQGLKQISRHKDQMTAETETPQDRVNV